MNIPSRAERKPARANLKMQRRAFQARRRPERLFHLKKKNRKTRPLLNDLVFVIIAALVMALLLTKL
jgi:hypothetical protein